MENQHHQNLIPILDAIPLPIAYANLNEKHILFNHNYLNFYGINKEHLINNSIKDLIGISNYSKRESHIKKALSGELSVFEYSQSDNHGSVTHYEIHHTPIKNNFQTVDGILITIIDITSQKMLIDTITKKNEYFKIFVEKSKDMISIHDKDFRYIYTNPTNERLSGISREFCTGKTFKELGLVSEERADQLHGLILKIFNDAKDIELTYEGISVDGVTRHFRTDFIPELNSTGQVDAVISITREITDIHHVKEALKSSEIRYKTIIDQSPFSIQIINLNGVTIHVNQAWKNLWGITLNDI